MDTFSPEDHLEISENIFRTKIEGLYFISKQNRHDDRGFFNQITIPPIEQAIGQEFTIKQINHSHSKTNVTRGFHAENWNKLICVTSGLAYCAIADIRPDSPTYSQSVTFLLGLDEEAANGSIFIVSGLANSFCVLKGPVDYMYAVDQLYSQRDTSGDLAISLFDPDININWPISRQDMILSQRDQDSIPLKQLHPQTP